MMGTRLPGSLALVSGMILAGGMGTGLAAQDKQAERAAQVDFARDIRPLFNRHCIKCHGGVKRAGHLSFIMRELAVATRPGEDRPILPGDPEHSELIRRVTTDDPDDHMPPPEHGAALSQREIELLRRWIKQGAPWKEHWAFVKPAPVPAPKVSRPEWCRQPIDAFILARLEAEGLSPSPEADRVQWLRRVSFDLIGLPPTPDDVAAFLLDNRADAYERVVDRLLASPQFGERWASMWLDLARYADSMGYEKDPSRTMWPWRDWVIRALNADMPFDEFTVRQIAGDLLPDATMEDRLASAFHRNTPTNTEGGTDDEEFRVAAVIDRVNTTWEVWQGLTFRCTQCHSHPYEPINHDEFYKFYALFNTTRDWDLRTEWPRLALPVKPAEYERANALDRQISRLRQEEFAQTSRLAELPGMWRPLRPDQASSTRGTKLVLREDGPWVDVQTEGTVVHYSEFTIEIPIPEDVQEMTALRVEALPVDPEKALLTPELGFIISQLRASLILPSTTAQLGSDSATPTSSAERGTKDAVAETDDSKGSRSVGSAQAESSPSNTAGARVGVEPPDKSKASSKQDSAPSKPTRATKQKSSPTPPQVIAFAHVFGDEAEPVYDPDTTLKDDKPGWGAMPRMTRPRHAVFVSAEPVALPSGARLRVVISHRDGPGDLAALVLRRCRFSISARREWTELLRDPTFQERRQQRDKLIAERRGIRSVSVPVMVEQEPHLRRVTAVFERGNWLNKGEVVAPAVPHIFPPLPKDMPANRLALARWLVAPDNPLTARVTVNRFWEQLFGTGLVETLENFGSSGAAPSHPELLDFLALRFQNELGWSVKRLLRELVLSATYRQDAAGTLASWEHDPRNRLLSRGPRMRLTAEMIRDQALAVSGLLSGKMYGPPVMPPQPEGIWNAARSGEKWKTATGEDRYRRAIYTYVRRTIGYPSFVIFDMPTREVCTSRRIRTNTPLQALVTLNDEAYAECAVALARRMQTEGGDTVAGQIARGYFLATGHRPDQFVAGELTALHDKALKHYREQPDLAKKLAPTPELAALAVVANAILNLDEVLNK